MDWVKLTTDYYNDFAIATGTDAMEVMFTRGNALAGKIEQHGFIPDAMLSHLTRKPAQAKKTAEQLVKAGLWERVRDGYMVVNFARINDELEKLVEKKRRDRDRKRAERAAAREAVSTDVSTDSPAPRPEDSLYESESKRKTKTTAAAAAVGTAAAAALPASIDILRSKLQAHTPLRALRFDTLDSAKVEILEELIHKHGDQVLVDVALRTLRTPPPTAVTAFIGTWAALPDPGVRLAVVKQQLCPTHGVPLSPSGTCKSCAADKKAADR